MRALRLSYALLAAASAFAQGGFTGPGRYEITNVKSGRALALDRGDRRSVVQAAPGSDNTVWEVVQAGGGTVYLRTANGLALEAVDNRNSAPVMAMPYNGRPSQQWRLVVGKDGNALITSATGKTLDVPDGTSRDGVRIQLYDSNGDSNQRFILRPAAASRPFRGMRDEAPQTSNQVQTLQCSSDDGRRKYCPADTSGGVRLTRQVSGSPCREGDTWGWDRSGVWVDRGCRAEFETGRTATRGSGTTPASRGQIVRCASDSGRNYCAADTSNGVRMVRSLGLLPCREGATWGYDRRGIWVDRGCRAEFEVGAGR